MPDSSGDAENKSHSSDPFKKWINNELCIDDLPEVPEGLTRTLRELDNVEFRFPDYSKLINDFRECLFKLNYEEVINRVDSGFSQLWVIIDDAKFAHIELHNYFVKILIDYRDFLIQTELSTEENKLNNRYFKVQAIEQVRAIRKVDININLLPRINKILNSELKRIQKRASAIGLSDTSLIIHLRNIVENALSTEN